MAFTKTTVQKLFKIVSDLQAKDFLRFCHAEVVEAKDDPRAVGLYYVCYATEERCPGRRLALAMSPTGYEQGCSYTFSNRCEPSYDPDTGTVRFDAPYGGGAPIAFKLFHSVKAPTTTTDQ